MGCCDESRLADPGGSMGLLSFSLEPTTLRGRKHSHLRADGPPVPSRSSPPKDREVFWLQSTLAGKDHPRAPPHKEPQTHTEARTETSEDTLLQAGLVARMFALNQARTGRSDMGADHLG